MSTHTPPSEWKLPINLAVGLHLLVLFCAMVLPGLLDQQTILPEITTIDLVSMGDSSAKNEPAAPPVKQATKQATKKETAPPVPPKPAEKIKPEVTKQTPLPVEPPPPVPVPVPEPAVAPEPVAPPAPAEAISIKPLKQKLKKVVKEIPDTRAEDARIRKDELQNITRKLQEEARVEAVAQETIRQQRQLAAAREDARRLDAEARRLDLEAKRLNLDATNALRDEIRATPSASISQASSQTGASNAQSESIMEQQYKSTLVGHIQPYWQPPDIKTWDPKLFAKVWITIASDGQIVSQVIEQGSGDTLFDQFVLKTLEAANPLPALPPALNKQRYEIGFIFKPSGIQ